MKKPVVWITGASSGIGAAVAKQYAQKGVRLILSARRKDVLKEVAEQCSPAEVALLPFDLAETQKASDHVAAALEIFGEVDILINNGGISQRSLIENTQYEVYSHLIEVDYLGTVALSVALLPHFIERKSGHYATVSSIMGKFSSPYRAGYCGAKHALHGFFDAMRMEQEKNGISVTMVCPGFINTQVSANAITGDGTPLGKSDRGTKLGVDVDRCARKIVRAIDQKKWEVYIGRKELLGIYLKRLSNKWNHRVVLKSQVR
ncbi:MAG: SDR family oxidoreductase [Flavobacteriaceae bacterium]